MATLDERVAFLEGQVVLLPQMIAGLRDDVSVLRHDLQDGLRVLHQDLRDEMNVRFGQVDRRFDQVDGRFDRLDARMDGSDGRIDRLERRFDGLDDKMSKQFFWLLGIQVTTFVTTLATILSVLYMRN